MDDHMDDPLGLAASSFGVYPRSPNSKLVRTCRGDPVPVDGQGITAYFQFVQNNMTQVTGGNVEHVMAEAEHRHRELMRETFEFLNGEYRKAL